MIYSGPRHRGACSIDERKPQKRRFYRPSLRVSAKMYYEGLKSALEREQSAIHEAELDAEALFCANPGDFRWIKLQHQLLFPRG